MKTKQFTLGIAIVAIAFTSLLSSCRKKDKEEIAINMLNNDVMFPHFLGHGV